MKLFFREYGNGIPIIIAHGLFGMSDNWIPVAKILSEQFKVYLLDLRNHGLSPNSDIHTYESLSNDIFEFLSNNEIDKAHFIGHSMGGKTILQFAKNHPEKNLSMTIVDISPKEYIPSETFFKKALNHKLLLEELQKINLDSFKNRKEFTEYLQNKFTNYFQLQLILKNIKTENKKFVWKINIDALYNHLNEMRNKIKPTEKMQKIKTQFIFGENSPYFNKEDRIYIKENLPQAEIKIIPNAGHLVHIEKQQEFIKVISLFINS
ncbi:MAG: alpha/beta fold hydrolase [Bacteroidales bacterium]|nr:alpha/beta fold hydrolase [Bacteroidales bacterium]